MSEMDKLKELIFDYLDETSKWKLPKGLKKSAYGDSRDFERGSYFTFQYILGKIKSIQRGDDEA